MRVPQSWATCGGWQVDIPEPRLQVQHCPYFTYGDGILPDGATPKLGQPHYLGSVRDRTLAIDRAGHDDYANSVIPTSFMEHGCEELEESRQPGELTARICRRSNTTTISASQPKPSGQQGP